MAALISTRCGHPSTLPTISRSCSSADSQQQCYIHRPCDAAAEAQAKHDHEGKNQHSDQEATSEEETSPLIPPAQVAPSQVAPSAEDQAEDQGPYQEKTNRATTKNNGEDQHSDPDVERGKDPDKEQRPHQEQGWPRRPVCVVPEPDDVF